MPSGSTGPQLDVALLDDVAFAHDIDIASTQVGTEGFLTDQDSILENPHGDPNPDEEPGEETHLFIG